MKRWLKYGSLLVVLLLAVALTGCDGPEIRIIGVANGFTYPGVVTPHVNVEGENVELTVTLNGEAYDGQTIVANGEYVLTAIAVDENDRTTTKTINFTIRQGATNVYVLDDFTNFGGWSVENAAAIDHNTDQEFVRIGHGSLRVDKGSGDARSFVRFRDYHPKYIRDLTAYNRMGLWLFVPNVTLLRPDAALGVNFWTDGGHVTFMHSSDQFVSGWNYVEVDLLDMDWDRSTVNLIELQLRTAPDNAQITYYYDNIELWWQE